MTEAGENISRIKNFLAVLAVATIPLHGSAPIQEENDLSVDHPILAEMVQRGVVHGDCEEVMSDLFSRIAITEKNESAFMALGHGNDSCEIIPLALGSEGQVNVPLASDSLAHKEGVRRAVFYHTHPLWNSISAGDYYDEMQTRVTKGNAPAYSMSPPSSDDYIAMINQLKMAQELGEDLSTLENRVVTPMGIWRYGLASHDSATIDEKVDESMKLGDLFGHAELMLHNGVGTEEAHAELDAIKQGYADVSFTMRELDLQHGTPFSRGAMIHYDAGDTVGVQSEIELKLKAAGDFSNAMRMIGYNVVFTPNREIRSLLKPK